MMRELMVLAIAYLLSSCATLSKQPQFEKKTMIIKEAGDILGGLSGLHRPALQEDGSRWTLLSVTDRGPNGKEFINNGKTYRSFLKPDFHPQVVRISISRDYSSILKVESKNIESAKGVPISGLPPDPNLLKVKEFEYPIFQSENQPLKWDPLGLDTEAITTDMQGNIWLAEEYRPGLIRLNSGGKIEKIYSPGTGPNDLPERLKERALNRGFEGLTFARGHLFGFIQSPLSLKASKALDKTRIVEFDPITEKVVGQYLYKLDDAKKSKIGDVCALPNGDILVVEQNGMKGKEGWHRIYKITPDSKYRQDRESDHSGIELDSESLPKTLILELESIGLNDFEKIEGITLLDDYTLALLNDNDFGLGEPDKAEASQLIIIKSLNAF